MKTLKTEFEKSTGILPLLLKLEGILSLLDVDMDGSDDDIMAQIEELAEVSFNDRVLSETADPNVHADEQRQTLVIFEFLLHLEESRWFGGEQKMKESNDQAII